MSLGWLGGVLAVWVVLAWLWTAWVRRRVRRAVPPIGQMMELTQARLHVLDRGPRQGDLPAVLMVHGLAGQLRHFSYALIDELANTQRVVTFDRPGSGYSSWKRGVRPSLQAQADLVADLIDRLELGPVVLVGHSLGGAIALDVALRHRKQVQALALLAPLTRVPASVPQVFRALLIPGRALCWAVAWTLLVPLSRWQRTAALARVFGPDPVPEDYGRRGGGDLALVPGHFVAAAEDLSQVVPALQATEARYPELSADRSLRIGILYGRGDQILDPVEQGEGLVRDLAHADWKLIDGGHMLPVVHPQICAQWIRRCASPGVPQAPSAGPVSHRGRVSDSG